jgi:hypothetical protein
MQRNPYDQKNCLEIGENAERTFIKLAIDKGHFIRKSNGGEDASQHWDVLLKNNCRVDVKAMKRIKRSDEFVQDEWCWVELHGVRKNDKGWLYGKAKVIAFETDKDFILVKRTDLIKLVNKYVNSDILVNSAEEAKYKVYQRRGRADKITLIETAKLKEIKHVIWSKNG